MPGDLIFSGPTTEISIGPSHKTFIIAEIGQNHQGDLEMAKQLISAAKEAGADCVKFQKSCLPERFTRAALSRPYDSVNSFGATYGEHRQHLEFTDEEFRLLQEHAAAQNVLFSASAMDTRSLYKMAAMNVPFIKIGSGDANNFPLIEKAAQLHIPLIVSTGMQTFDTVEKIYTLISEHHKKFVLMHCVSSYPTSPEDANLNLIHVYKEKFSDVHIGYSGHEIGSFTHFAVAAGAQVVERHFTLDNTLKGSDHACSLVPKDFKAMVNEIRRVEALLGSCQKYVLASELPCRSKLGKSLVAARTLKSGEVLSPDDVAVKVSHPPGIPAENSRQLVGLRLSKDLEPDANFSYDFLQPISLS